MTHRGLSYIDIKCDDATNVVLGGITQCRAFTGSEVRTEATSGEAYARWQAIYGQAPGISFTTKKIAAALDVCGAAGLRISGGSGGKTGLTAYFQKQKEGGTRESGSTHLKANIIEGLLVPRRLSVAHQGDAELTYDALASWDGTNDPIVVTDEVALPAAPTDSERFTLGPVSLNGTAFDRITNLSIDFGIAAEMVTADSDLWPKFARISEIMPLIELDGIDTDWFEACGLDGTNIVHASTTLVLRKRALGGTFVAAGTSEHIAITCCGLLYPEDIAAAQAQQIATGKLRLPLRYDGTNLPLVIDTTATHS